MNRPDVERIDQALNQSLQDFEIHGGKVRYWASLEDAKRKLLPYIAHLEAEVERLKERVPPESCGEGCDACPPPKDCPLTNLLADCVCDGHAGLRKENERLRGALEHCANHAGTASPCVGCPAAHGIGTPVGGCHVQDGLDEWLAPKEPSHE